MKIRYFVMDVDGTLTDGKIYMGNDGEMIKVFNVKDGCGIHDILITAGIIPVIITGRKSRILDNRCAELGITEVYQGIRDKVGKLNEVINKYEPEKIKECTMSGVAYIGDDINDIAVMNIIKNGGGIVGCPSDAVQSVKEIADFISSKCGGDGAVREFIEYIIQKGI